jgi:hypothetical protein
MAARKSLEEEIKVGLISAFFNIHARLTDGFDQDDAFGFGHVPSSSTEDMVLTFTRASDPNDTVLARNGHSILAVLQIEQFAGMKEQLDPWGL